MWMHETGQERKKSNSGTKTKYMCMNLTHSSGLLRLHEKAEHSPEQHCIVLKSGEKLCASRSEGLEKMLVATNTTDSAPLISSLKGKLAKSKRREYAWAVTSAVLWQFRRATLWCNSTWRQPSQTSLFYFVSSFNSTLKLRPVQHCDDPQLATANHTLPSIGHHLPSKRTARPIVARKSLLC